MNKSGGGDYILLDYLMFLPFILLIIGITLFFTINKEGLGGITTGTGYSIDNIGISTKTKRSG